MFPSNGSLFGAKPNPFASNPNLFVGPPLFSAPNFNENNVVLDSFNIEKDEYALKLSRFEKSIGFEAIKGSSWFIGRKDDLPDEDLEFSWKELQKGHMDLIPKGLKQLKIIAKGFTVLLELNQEITSENKEIHALKLENQALKREIINLKSSINNIVHVTVHADKVRRPYKPGEIAIKLTVDKKKPDSILLINGVLCVHGHGTNAESGQYWKFGGKTTVYGQTEGFSNNSGYGSAVTTMSVITNHNDIGPQELSLSWHQNINPFTIINPNKQDHANYYENQTQSVITVWEIMQ